MFDDDPSQSESSQNTLFDDAPKDHAEIRHKKPTSKKPKKKPIKQVDKKNFKTKKGEREQKVKTIVKKKPTISQENKKSSPKKKTPNSKQTAIKAFTQDVLEALFEFNQGKW